MRIIRSFLLGFGLMAGFTAAAADNFQLTGPFTHENLTIYLLRGKAGVKSKLLPLQEAMAQKKVAIYETGNVSQLSIENSSDQDVYVQSGDIVKGGRQDRVLTTDFVLPAHSGRLPISSFCVEQGRWSKRGVESDSQFSTSTQVVPSKGLKMAVRQTGAQSAVWAGVAESRAMLAPPAPPPPPGSPAPAHTARMVPASTSMQEALEARQVVDATDAYVKTLVKVVDGQPDAIGYVYVINGAVNSAEVYSSPELFRQMWPKLLRASATEAVAEKSKTKVTATPGATDVKAMLVEAERGNPSSKDTAGRTTVTRKESRKVVLFETHDPKSGEEWIHRSYVVK